MRQPMLTQRNSFASAFMAYVSCERCSLLSEYSPGEKSLLRSLAGIRRDDESDMSENDEAVSSSSSSSCTMIFCNFVCSMTTLAERRNKCATYESQYYYACTHTESSETEGGVRARS